MTARLATDAVTDDYMHERLAEATTYTLVVLRATAQYAGEGYRPITWEDVRRNMALQRADIMPIVCPIGGQISGIGIFGTDPAETTAIMADDPGAHQNLHIRDPPVHGVSRATRSCPDVWSVDGTHGKTLRLAAR